MNKKNGSINKTPAMADRTLNLEFLMNELLEEFREYFDDAFASGATFDTHVSITHSDRIELVSTNGPTCVSKTFLEIVTTANIYEIVLLSAEEPGDAPYRDEIFVTARRRGVLGSRSVPIPIGSGNFCLGTVADLFDQMFAHEMLSIWSPNRGIQLVQDTFAVENAEAQPGYVLGPDTKQ